MKCELIAHRDMQGGGESYGVLTDAKNWIFWKWDGNHFYRSKSFSLEYDCGKILGILLHLVKKAHEEQTKLKENQPSSTSKDQTKRKLNFPEYEHEESFTDENNDVNTKISFQKQKRGLNRRNQESTSSLDIPSTPDAKRSKSRQRRQMKEQKEIESDISSSSPSEDSSDDVFIKNTSPQAPKMRQTRSMTQKKELVKSKTNERDSGSDDSIEFLQQLENSLSTGIRVFQAQIEERIRLKKKRRGVYQSPCLIFIGNQYQSYLYYQLKRKQCKMLFLLCFILCQ